MSMDASRMQEAQELQAEMMAEPLNWVSWISVVVVVVFGVMKTQEGTNQYGEPPAS